MERPSQNRSVVSFFGGNVAAAALSLMATLLIMHWTPPQQLGIWNFALLVSTYVSVCQAGVFNGLNRQLPYFDGQGDSRAVTRLANAAHGWCLALLFVSVATTLGVSIGFALLGGLREHIATALAIGTVVCCSWFLQFYTVIYSGRSKFGLLAGKNALTALVGLPLALMSYVMGYAGLLVRAAVMAVLNILLLRRKLPLTSRPSWDPCALMELARVGFPIWSIGQLGALFMTLDRVVLADSAQALGLYAIAVQFGAVAAMVPTSFNAVHYPQMARDYGASHRARPLWSQAAQVTLRSAICASALSATCWFIIPVFVEHLLPAYTPGIAAAKWATLTGVALAPSIFVNIFNLLGRQYIYLASSAAGLVAFASLWFVLTKVLHLPPLVSAAQSMLAGTLVSSIVSAILALVVCSRHDVKHKDVTQAERAVRS